MLRLEWVEQGMHVSMQNPSCQSSDEAENKAPVYAAIFCEAANGGCTKRKELADVELLSPCIIDGATISLGFTDSMGKQRKLSFI